jgi:hypothetical protein
VPADRVGDPRRLVGVVDADVDVHARRRVAVLGVLDAFELRAVAGLLGVVEFAPVRGRVEPSGGDAEAVRGGVFDQGLAHRVHPLLGGGERVGRRYLRLDDALEQLVVEPPLQYLRRVGPVDERVRPGDGPSIGVHHEELLLDTNGAHPVERVGRPECLHADDL